MNRDILRLAIPNILSNITVLLPGLEALALMRIYEKTAKLTIFK